MKCVFIVCSFVLKVNKVTVLFLSCSLKVTVLVLRPGVLVLPLLSWSHHWLYPRQHQFYSVYVSPYDPEEFLSFDRSLK